MGSTAPPPAPAASGGGGGAAELPPAAGPNGVGELPKWGGWATLGTGELNAAIASANEGGGGELLGGGGAETVAGYPGGGPYRLEVMLLDGTPNAPGWVKDEWLADAVTMNEAPACGQPSWSSATACVASSMRRNN